MKGKSVKKILLFKASIIICVLTVLLIPINLIFYLKFFHEQQKESSQQMFHQVAQVIKTNENELSEERDEYSEYCIQKAEMVAYFMGYEPDTINDLESMRELARVLDIDEIHIFNTQGEIYAGTHPEYYGYTVYSGEQMAFFEQMLNDKTLSLCQDIMPNTVEGKEMQYAAVWLDNESGFVQIGMRPERLLRLMEEKSLQGIVKNIPFEKKEFFHIVDLNQGKIIASSVERIVGQDFSEDMASLQSEKTFEIVQMHWKFNGERYCVYMQRFGEYLLIHTYTSKYIFSKISDISIIFLLTVLLVTFTVIYIFLRYVHHYIVNNVFVLNEKLKKIEQGNLENLEMDTQILEFDSLVYYINQLLRSIRLDNKQFQDILNSGQISLGVFDYNLFYKKIFLNQWMENILGVYFTEKQSFDTKKNMVLEKLNEIEQNCVDKMQGIYKYQKDGKILYVRLKKYSDTQREIYYLIDVSSWWERMNVMKDDSFKDVLTGLLNRRGVQENAKHIFEDQQILGHAAVILLDADGLKRMNDLYGHAVGDAYLSKIAAILSEFPEEHTISARLGGDEFVVIVYGYDQKESVDCIIKELKSKRGTLFEHFQLMHEERLEFSIGYSYAPSEGIEYQKLMSLADERMYQEKRKRKLEATKGNI